MLLLACSSPFKTLDGARLLPTTILFLLPLPQSGYWFSSNLIPHSNCWECLVWLRLAFCTLQSQNQPQKTQLTVF